MPNLDRFAIGLADSQDADFWECPKCGGEVYDMEAEECTACRETEAGKRMQAFRKELRELEERHRVRISPHYGDVYLVDMESGEEEEL